MKRFAPAAIMLPLGIVALLLTLTLQAGAKDTPAAGAAEVGQEAPGFTLTTVGGDEVSLSDYQGKIVVLHFQSMTCPWDLGYQPMLTKMASDHMAAAEASDTADASSDKASEMAAKPAAGDEAAAPEVVFLAINSNKTESADDLAGYHDKVSMVYPILKDKGNTVADQYAAQTTPHMYIIDAEGVLRYMGGIEEAPRSPAGIGQSEKQYFADALTAVIAGNEPDPTTSEPKGCSIKREKK